VKSTLVNNQEPKHRILQSLGIMFAGLGLFLAGIAFLIWVLRPPAAPLPTIHVPPVSTFQESDEKIQKYIANHKDLGDLINHSEFHKILEDYAKEATKDKPLKEKKTESKAAQP
jgi:hypothetical protein